MDGGQPNLPAISSSPSSRRPSANASMQKDLLSPERPASGRAASAASRPRTRSGSSGITAAPSDPLTAELQSRLFTVAARRDPPHFSLAKSQKPHLGASATQNNIVGDAAQPLRPIQNRPLPPRLAPIAAAADASGPQALSPSSSSATTVPLIPHQFIPESIFSSYKYSKHEQRPLNPIILRAKRPSMSPVRPIAAADPTSPQRNSAVPAIASTLQPPQVIVEGMSVESSEVASIAGVSMTPSVAPITPPSSNIDRESKRARVQDGAGASYSSINQPHHEEMAVDANEDEMLADAQTVPLAQIASKAASRSAPTHNNDVEYAALKDAQQTNPAFLDASHPQSPFAFLKHIEASPETKDFVYMIPIQAALRRGQPTFNPYNLQIVEFSEIDTKSSSGFYTMSSQGVTHFNNLGHGEFTPLQQWVREHSLFHSLLRIPFFARYRMWKCFTLWRKTVLHTKIQHAKKQLAKHLFVLHPVLRFALLEIQKLNMDIVLNKRMVSVEDDKNYELNEFVKNQKMWVEQISVVILRSWGDRVREIVEDAGKKCLKEKGFDVEMASNASGNQGSLNKIQLQPSGSEPAETSISDPLSPKKLADITNEPRKLTFTEQAARRSECRRLQRFVKLIDYTLIYTLQMLAMQSVQDLLKYTFHGCRDDDVIVDGSGTGTVMVGEGGIVVMSDGTVHGVIDKSALAATNPTGPVTVDTEGLTSAAGISIMVSNVSSGQPGVIINAPNAGGANIPGGLANVQVGGLVVGTDVPTSQLAECGFYGFSDILSRILIATMIKMQLIEVVEEGGQILDASEADENKIDAANTNTSHPAARRADALQTNANASTRVAAGTTTVAAPGTTTGSLMHPAQFVALFRTELFVHQHDQTRKFYFSPSLQDYITAIDTILKIYMSTVERFPMLTNSIPFLDPANLAGGAYSAVRGLEDSEFGEGPQVESIIMDGGYFRELCGRIRGVLVGMFSNAFRWVSTLETVRNMWIENEGFHGLDALREAAGETAFLLATTSTEGAEGGVAAILLSDKARRDAAETQRLIEEAANGVSDGSSASNDAQKQESSSKPVNILELGCNVAYRPDGTKYSPLVDFFESALSKFAHQKQMMTSIPVRSTINNLLIDTNKLKSVLVPSPERCFNEVAKILPGLSRDKNELLLTEVQTWVRVLNTQPSNVEGFVEYLGWLEKVRESMPVVDQLEDEVTHLYGLLEQYRITIQPTDLAMFQTLGPTLRTLKDSVDVAMDTKEESITRFTIDLEKSMSELMSEVSDIRNRAQDPMVLNSGSKSDTVIKFLEDLRSQLEKVEILKKRYESWGELFRRGGSSEPAAAGEGEGKLAASATRSSNMALAAPGTPAAGASKGSELEETKTEIDLKRTLWTSLKEWEALTESWRTQPFDSLVTDDINARITAFLKIVYNLDKGLPPNEVVPKLKSMVDEYRSMYPTIVDLRNPSLKQRHWEKIQDAIGKTLVRDETFTLAKLIELRVFEFKEEIGGISSQAGSEAALEEMLAKVVKNWSEAEFIVTPYRDNKDVFILGTVEDIQTLLEDSQVTIATIKGSRFIGPIKSEVEKWDKQLSLFSETLDSWLNCQRNWLYLESIFSAPDIQRQLPDEARMFSQVDRSWKDVMRKVSRNPNAIKSGTMPGLLETMQQNNVLLDQIQKCLEDYLESKRLLFPRFYFLSNDELLEILSQTKNPQAVQPHLGKCFDAIKSLEFSSNDPKSIDIVAMISPEGERVPFLKNIKARGNVEGWLGNVEEAMVAVLRRLIKSAIADFEDAKRSEWVREHVGQVVVTGNQVIWTRDVTECLKSSDPGKTLATLKQKCINNLSGVAMLVRGELTRIQRAILGALITIDVHNRDIVHSLIAAKVSGAGDFEWTKQMRYYWDVDSDTCHVKMSTSVFSYGYEYLGAASRLVQTALTDRCYLTLTGAMQLNLGGSPVGPAGTGKCWGLGTRLVMMDGSLRCVEQIEEGEMLMGPDKKPRVVAHGSLTRGTGPMFRIKSPEDANVMSWTCNADHILVVRNMAKPVVVADSDLAGFVKVVVVKRVTDESCVAAWQTLDKHVFGTSDEAQEFVDAHVMPSWKPVEFECTVRDYLRYATDDLNTQHNVMFKADGFSQVICDASVERVASGKKTAQHCETVDGTTSVGCYKFTIQSIGVDAYYGFCLVNPDGSKSDGRCLLEDGTVTHNTETVKDLAKALARQCIVVNCSDGMDYKMMGKMFAGLAQSGAWCCFDEFNRIDIEVLSVIAQQLLTIKNAKDMKATKFMFEGREIRLIETAAAFITMNPGYAGRTELPDNLKALFRPIAMMIPDYGLIAEIILFSEGFESAKQLSGKVVNLYKLCSEQLSQQDHYDFGMRAVKSVLIMAGALKRSNPELSEDVVLIRSLRDSNLPKFLAEDIGLFRGILSDLFPGITVPDRDFGALVGSVKEVMFERNLEIVESFVSRVCQLSETMHIRHGVMLVGPTGSGKTTCYEVLTEASARLHDQGSSEYQKVKTWVLNPKCVAMTELYGEFNLATMEWKDGLIGSIFRAQVSDNSSDEKWTVCDGPVDALWIENMNTVLDDNKLLTLINGERIKMNATMHMLFEVADLAVASPATVSRCGMVYMDPAMLDWQAYVKTTVRKMPTHVTEDLNNHLLTLFDKFVDPGLRFVRRHCKEYIRSVDLNLVTSLCKLLRTFINRTKEIDFKMPSADLNALFTNIFLFCYVWSVGGNLADGFQDSFDTFMRDMLENSSMGEIQFPSANTVFGYFVDLKTRNFVQWEDIVPSFKYSADIPYFEMMVPTPDTVKYAYLLDALLSNSFPTLFTGNTGVGKSVIVQDLLSRMSKSTKFVQVVLNFSAQTTSAQTQQMMELKLEKKRKNISGAPAGFSKIVLFVNDLNMPKMDTYGSQPPIELLRQYIDFGGFYDREKLTWKIIQDVDIVAACAPPGGGRNNVTPRLLRHFNMLNIPAPSEQSLSKIFKSIVEGFLKPFSAEVKSSCEAIVNSAIEIYHRMCTELLPTPAKSHYTFNLRDLSKVIQGILQVRPSVVTSKAELARLFCHEASRVFHDRLIDEADRSYFNGLISELAEKSFGVQISKESFAQSPIMFGDFSKRGVAPEDRIYSEMSDMKAMTTLLEEYLEEYNVTMNKDLRLIFFMDAKQHITRISRIIRQPRGNALLIGVGGTGKQSLTRLACHISDYQCIQIELTRTYGHDEWREDIKRLYRLAGVEAKNTVFLLSDTQIKKEAFLEDINGILNSGEVPNLFEFDEREKILGDLRPLAREKGLPEDRDSVYQMFINRVRDNLHIVFGTSPVGDTFRTRCRMFPSLVNCCTIDWFDEWPKDALLSVSRRFFEFVDLGNDEIKEKVASMCVEIHASVGEIAKRFYAELRRRYYTTPTSYLELINLYIAMLQEKRKELGSARDRLRNGLNKLAETNDLVAKMQVELESLGPELKIRAQDTEALMIKIAKDQETADGVRKVVSEEEAVVREKALQTEAIATEAQKDLDEALPALEAAYKALDGLEKKDIAELKVFSKPPDLVLMVMEAICILFKLKPDWENSKKLLSDPQLMKKMAEYDKDNIPESVSKKLKKYIESPNFNPEAVEKVSRACKSMCMWVIAMDLYSRVYKEVLPKRKRLEEAQQTLEETRSKLAEKTAALAEVENQLDKLKAKYENSVAAKKQLVEKMEETTRRLSRASKLTLALADEQIRWTDSVERLNLQIDLLVGNIFLSAACVAYFGAFTSNYRAELVQRWVFSCKAADIPVSDTFNLLENLADPAVVRDWNIQGLPADALSIENGILVTRGRRWPLMIDPQGQANRWIRSMDGNELKVVKLTEPKFLRSLENAVRTGQPVLLEDVGEQLDPALEPLLLKQTIRQGGRVLMKLGDSFVEYDRNFKLYITTKMPNPHYLPEVCIKVTIINFTVTKVGLEGQLLAEVVKLERPELEEQRNSLIVNIASDKKQLKDIEEKILKLLFNSQGNILDDEELINTLNQSKVTSAAINERVLQAEQTEQDINMAREKYRPVAIRGSVLYFVISDLAEIDPMYQFSLKYFKNLFNNCIMQSEKTDDLNKRIQILCKNATYETFSNVSRGLFEAHKMIFAFMICIETMREKSIINDLEWNFFLRGSGIIRTDLPARPNARWLSSYMWQNLCDLALTVPQFAYTIDHIAIYPADWESLVDADSPYTMPVPGDTRSQLTDMQRLLLVKVLREEKLVQSAVEFVKRNLGPEFIDIPPLDLAKAYKDTSTSSPLIFILSTGSDPVSSLIKFASSTKISMQDKLHMISLGQGQGPIAEELIKRATSSGDWVFLQNCHLAASWMNQLENIVKEFGLPETEINSNFRLFLSSMPSKVFPISVLQEGVKVTNEPPKGLRANLARSFADISKDLFDDHPPQGVKFRKLLFGVCFFNAIIHERKKFGPLGWNILYDWSNSDLEVSITILRNMLQEYKTIPWEALQYLTGEITFGGRVTDDWDRRSLRSILTRFYTPQILEDVYKFSPSGIYFAPPDGDIASFRAYIDGLPFTEEPSVFGMHENANISFQLQETRRLIKAVLDVQPRLTSGSGGKSSEEIVTNIASTILDDWPALLVIELPDNRPSSGRAGGNSVTAESTSNPINESLFKRDESGRMLNSLSTVLLQEAARFNKLNNLVRISLESLIKAVKGLIVMSSELELVFKSLLNNEVPNAWANHAYPSLKPLTSWVKDFQRRVETLRSWAEQGQPKSFWLPGFFFPQGFLTGVLQNHARKFNIPIDSLSFSYKVKDFDENDQRVQTTFNDEEGVLISGLFMEGARWDREKRLLQDSFPIEMYSVMPLIRFIPTQNGGPKERQYVCPLYKTSARAGTLSTTGHSTNFVVPIYLPSDKPQDYWIAKGVALLCQLNE